MQEKTTSVSDSVPGAGDSASILDRLGLRNPRLLLPAIVFVLIILMMQLERLAIVFTLRGRFDGVHAGTLVKSLLIGVRFDVVVAAMALVPLLPMVLLATPRVLRSRWHRRMVGFYCGLVISIAAFICIVDYFFFRQFTERLDSRAISYIGDEGNEYLLHLLITRYPLIPAILVTIVVLVVAMRATTRWKFIDRHADLTILQAILCPAIICPLIFLAIRGTTSSHSINSSVAYFDPNAAVSQLTLNGAFTLRHAIISSWLERVELSDLFQTIPHDEAIRRVTSLAASPQDTFKNDPENPLRRITRTERPRRDANVVLVVLESLSWHYIGPLGGHAYLTPNLNRLASEGMLFTECFAVGKRTQRGFSGIVSAFPDLPEHSVTVRPEVTGRFITLGSVLAERGYETLFVYAGPGHRDHRQSYLGSNGYKRFVTIDDMVTRNFETNLGLSDEDLFNTADAVFRTEKQPFFATLLTLSFHPPFLIPPNRIKPVKPGHRFAKQLDCINYTDWAIGQFIERAKQSDYFKNTIFVFVADHMGGYREVPCTPATYRVPFIIYAPGIISKGQKIASVCSQMDIAPTIMWLLGGEYEHCFFGSSALGPGGDHRYGFSLMGDSGLLFYDSRGIITCVPPYRGKQSLYQYAPPETLTSLDPFSPEYADGVTEATRNAVAIQQMAQWLFENGRFNTHVGQPPLIAGAGRQIK